MHGIIIIGGGVVGFGAAMYSGRFNMKTLVIAESFGGTILTADKVKNYPGFKEISGEELAERIEEHARDYNIEVKEEKAVKIKKEKDSFKVITGQAEYSGKTVLIATGSKKRQADIPGAKEFNNKGVHYCAVCDGPVYEGKIVGVVGGSDSAAKSALFLSQHAKKVYIIYRKPKIRAEPIYYKNVMENKKIEVINNTNITEIKGDKFVNSVVLDNEYKGKKEIKVEAVFFEIGQIPLSNLIEGLGVKTNEKGEIIIDKYSCTNIPGVYAGGDVTDINFKQVATGISQGILAVFSAFKFVKKK